MFWDETYGVSNAVSRDKAGGVGEADRGDLMILTLSGSFGNQLRWKMRNDKKRLLSEDFSERCVKVTCLVCVNRVSLDFHTLFVLLSNVSNCCSGHFSRVLFY